MPKMLDLFCGTKSIAKAFERAGWETYTVDWEERFEPTLCCDVNTLTVDKIIELCDGKPDFVHMSPDCFPEGNLVWTDKGYKDIKDIQEGDNVLTHLGNYKAVSRKIVKRANELCKIKISGCEEILVTPNHPFYVRKKKRVFRRENGVKIGKTKLLEPEWVEAKDLTNEYRVGIPINTKSELPVWNGIEKHRRNNKTYAVENTLSQYMNNEDFWWVIGRYFGDGSLSYQKYTIDISCAKDEVDEIKPYLDRIGVKYSLHEKYTANHFYICSKEWCVFLAQFGIGALNKMVTPTILNLPINLLCSFLSGYISADGCLNTYFANNSYHITTVSKRLAYGLQMCMLKALGRYASMTTRTNQSSTIQGRKVNVHQPYQLCFYKDFNEKRTQYYIEDNVAWVNIKKNEHIYDDEKLVYTMSVDDDESYTVNNIAVHNCSSYSVAAIFHHRKKNEETGELEPITDYAKFCDKTNAYIIDLIVNQLKPKYWTIENPRAGMRKMDFVQELPRYTTTYCQYGDTRQKPTDIWTNIPNPNFLPPCKPGSSCHEAAPRGSKTGTQGLKGSKERAQMPDKLCDYMVSLVTQQND